MKTKELYIGKEKKEHHRFLGTPVYTLTEAKIELSHNPHFKLVFDNNIGESELGILEQISGSEIAFFVIGKNYLKLICSVD